MACPSRRRPPSRLARRGFNRRVAPTLRPSCRGFNRRAWIRASCYTTTESWEGASHGRIDPAFRGRPPWPRFAMPTAELSDVVLAFCLVLLNGFFVGAEFSLVQSRMTRLQEIAEKGNVF